MPPEPLSQFASAHDVRRMVLLGLLVGLPAAFAAIGWLGRASWRQFSHRRRAIAAALAVLGLAIVAGILVAGMLVFVGLGFSGQ